MKFKDLLVKIFTFGLYQPTWRCNGCGKEIFDGEYFCKDCKEILPYINSPICNHCGRQVKADTDYCLTCKNSLTSFDTARAVFNYDKPVSSLIKRAKYRNGIYILDYFAKELSYLYFKCFFKSQVVVCIPMSKKRLKRRGYNQSKILAEKVSELIGVPFSGCVEKSKETVRQAKLGRSDRLKNLTDTFKVTDKSAVNGKSVLIVDDVSTTGATAEVLSAKLKKAGATAINVITVANVPSRNGL